MYKNKNSKNPIYQLPLFLVLIGSLVISACSDSTTSGELGSTPAEVSFTVEPVSDEANTFEVESTTEGAFMWEWDFGDGKGWQKGSEIDTAYYAAKGGYDIKLRAYSKAGSDIASKSIDVAENDCSDDLEKLTGCDSKTWVLKPDAGSLWIGPADFSATWWSNTEEDVEARSCIFNDEMTFNYDGTMDRNLQGDIWVDEEGETNPFPEDIIANNDGSMEVGCYDWSEINSDYDAWGSGAFSYDLSGDEIKIMGEGAYLGLYKAGDDDITDSPEESDITYEIVEFTEDEIVVAKIYDWGAWQFTYAPKQ